MPSNMHHEPVPDRRDTAEPVPLDRVDARTYGRSFADVYDTWYPADSSTDRAVDYIRGLCSPGARILELGVGTGRLAIPLAQSGFEVWGIDSSIEMLDQLNTKAHTTGVSIETICADVTDGDSWPGPTFDVVIAAFNFMFNIIGDGPKSTVFANAASHMHTGSSLVVESAVPVESDQVTDRRLEVRSVDSEAVVLIASSTDHTTGIVAGQHIELRDGEPVRLRPWQVHMSAPDRFDQMAIDAGLTLIERRGDWDQVDFDESSLRFIARYAS